MVAGGEMSWFSVGKWDVFLFEWGWSDGMNGNGVEVGIFLVAGVT
jgi:hypothetical protein